MNCISIALFPIQAGAIVRRVIEYFYPAEGNSRIWLDIFVENPADSDVALRILHAGSLHAQDVTNDSWMRQDVDKHYCETVLTKRIRALHETYCPIAVDHNTDSVWLDRSEYRCWNRGMPNVIIGDDSSKDVLFTLWEIGPLFRNVGTVLRLRLEMHESTSQQRFAEKDSFLAHGEAIVLNAVERKLHSYTGSEGDRLRAHFTDFKKGHKIPETFEYLIVAPDATTLRWDAVALSAGISPKLIEPGPLAKTTRWFATDSPYLDDWNARFVLEVKRTDEVSTPTEAGNMALPRAS